MFRRRTARRNANPAVEAVDRAAMIRRFLHEVAYTIQTTNQGVTRVSETPNQIVLHIDGHCTLTLLFNGGYLIGMASNPQALEAARRIVTNACTQVVSAQLTFMVSSH